MNNTRFSDHLAATVMMRDKFITFVQLKSMKCVEILRLLVR